MAELLTFQTFKTRNEADEVAALLQAAGIPFLMDEARNLLDSNFTGAQFYDPFMLKLLPEHFEQAGKIIADNIKIDLASVDKDYMLLKMTDDELRDVASKPDEWGIYNCKLAVAILEQRGAPLTSSQLEQMREVRYEQLAEPVPFDKSWIFVGYTISIAAAVIAYWFFLDTMIMTFISLFGLILGWSIMKAKITLPDGKRISKYDKPSRTHGRVLFIIGIITCLLGLLGFIRYFIGDVPVLNNLYF